jgi:hypothetical protein
MTKIIAPLPNWNVRGYSYGELQPDGQRHTGADLNVGYGDDDLGLPVLCFADGVVVERHDWDGHTHGFGNVALVEHQLFRPSDSAGDSPDQPAEHRPGLRLWSAYAHLDAFDPSLIEGAPIEAGAPIGTCGKSGGQTWAHLHFELRYQGPPAMPATYWGGRLSYEAQSDRFADPYTVLRLLEGAGVHDAEEDVIARLTRAEHDLRITQIDRERNFALKMEMESYLRKLEGDKRVRRGTTDRLIKRVIG